MNGGYIKLFRSLLSWEWYQDISTKVLWIHILLKATHKETKVKGVDIPRGGLLTSVRELAAETGLTERKIRTALVHLQNSQNLTQKATSKGTLIIIENYGFYQSEGKETDTQTDKQPTHNRHTTDTPIEQESKNVRVSITKEYKDTNNNNIYNYNSIGKVVDCAHARTREEIRSTGEELKPIGSEKKLVQELVQAPPANREEIEARIQAKIAAWQRGEVPR